MWIKAVFCTRDAVYAERLISFFDREYVNKIELNLCPTIESFFDYIGQYTIDIALFGEELEEEIQKKLKDISCPCALITEQIYETNIHGLTQIGKFQKGDAIYKDIFELYSSGKRVKQISLNHSGNEMQKIYAFISASGGSGTSTIAKAYARRCASYDKVLYLDLGLFSCTEVAEGNANGMDEVIRALKSRRNILPLKLVSAVAKTRDRIFTYGPCSNTCNLLELNAEDIRNLISGLTALSEYKKIIVDIGASISWKEIEFLKSADAVICVADESEIGDRKFRKLYEFMENAGNKEGIRLVKKMFVFRNKIRQDYESGSANYQSGVIGWAPWVLLDSYDAVVDRIAQSDSFNNLEISND